MTSIRLTTAVAAVTILSVALTGCISEPSRDSSSAARVDDDASDIPAADQPAVEQETPLDPYFDVLYSRSSDAEYKKYFRTTEEALAACMTAAGFEYIPRPEAYVDAQSALAKVSDGTREWTEANGYGFYASTQEEIAAMEASDPNVAIVAELSDSESRAYFLALNGDQNSQAAGEGTTGCYGEASTGEPPPSLSERYAPLVQALDRLYGETIALNDEVISIEAEWSECMASRGRPGLATRLAAQDAASQSGGGYMQSAGIGGDPDKLRLEVAIALDDFDCAIETRFDERMRAITVEAETKFLAQNRALLDPLLSEADQGLDR